ncbi:hypothetical protein ACFSW8_09810 [Rubritalea tangerina]|uniref:Cytochrome c domain-containing protein n=2 Tax=Rubritalea tangerina TaxID=430798 RepID=A0ABW4ZC27_9BACT
MVHAQEVKGQYGALALREPVAELPHFQTDLGRRGHRFADATINQYRIYDFYARQARHHLSQATIPDLLLPYPGLEGGRRGHWGVTNEKTSAAYLGRVEEPVYHRLVNRGKGGDQYIVSGEEGKQAVCFLRGGAPVVEKVVLDAELRAPVHAFAHVVDRFGFGMTLNGKDYFIHSGAEWYGGEGGAMTVTKQGYYLHQDAVVFSRSVGGVAMLDSPRVSRVGGKPIYSRHFEWMEDGGAKRYKLAKAAVRLQNPKVKVTRTGNAWWCVVRGEKQRVVYQVQYSGDPGTVKVREEGGDYWVDFSALKKGDQVQVASWASALEVEETTFPEIALEKLSACLAGGERYFKDEVKVAGVLNADPAASGTAYEIDDIPVPVENPYGTPMTLCGVAFDSKGVAYVSSLVGDVWRVRGLDGDLKEVVWQRFASGLNTPLGMEMVDDVLHVVTKTQVLQVSDLNGDGEADRVKPFTGVRLPSDHAHDLQTDAGGNFYFSNVNGTHRLSRDGKKLDVVGHRARNPFGLGVRADGLVLSDSSEGDRGNGTCTIFESQHPENAGSVAKLRRILYLPRGVDNSPGSRLFMDSGSFGPLGKSIVGVSYGSGRMYQVMRNKNNGSPQAALQMLPGEFSSGSARLSTSPKDGQLYVVGFDAWGDFAVKEGCLHRVRYTGKKYLGPSGWEAYSNGISVKFEQALDPESVTHIFVQQWNYIDSAHSYGSAEYSVKHPEQIGHDYLEVASVYLSDDGKELFINVPAILPAMCTQVFGDLRSISGDAVSLNLFATLNQLPKVAMKGVMAQEGKAYDLKVPFKQKNGNTYATLMEFFDARAGRDSFKRPVGPSVRYREEDLNYDWVHQNIIMGQGCIACHNASSKYDFSSYESLLRVIDTESPSKSHILGMVNTGSMPPYPMPTVDSKMQRALELWIQKGAPKN